MISMKNLKNRKWTLAKRPIGMVGEHNFSFEEEEVRDIQEGEFLIKNLINVRAKVKTSSKTGVEMEALAAVSVAALTIYDMCKAADRGMRISDIRVIYKSGGKSGDFEAK